MPLVCRLVACALTLGFVSPAAFAQADARAAAPCDLTGYWVSTVTEDWRWRIMTAPA